MISENDQEIAREIQFAAVSARHAMEALQMLMNDRFHMARSHELKNAIGEARLPCAFGKTVNALRDLVLEMNAIALPTAKG